MDELEDEDILKVNVQTRWLSRSRYRGAGDQGIDKEVYMVKMEARECQRVYKELLDARDLYRRAGGHRS